MDLDAIHAYLTRSYWSEGISKELVARALAGSLCFGLLAGGRQIGFARVIRSMMPSNSPVPVDVRLNARSFR